jgi:hypothetical protein
MLLLHNAHNIKNQFIQINFNPISPNISTPQLTVWDLQLEISTMILTTNSSDKIWTMEFMMVSVEPKDQDQLLHAELIM